MVVHASPEPPSAVSPPPAIVPAQPESYPVGSFEVSLSIQSRELSMVIYPIDRSRVFPSAFTRLFVRLETTPQTDVPPDSVPGMTKLSSCIRTFTWALGILLYSF